MKVILYMAISVNGIIAKGDDDTSWISKEEWDSYSLAVRTAGCLIVGRRTYHILTKQPEFAEFKDVKLVAVSHENFEIQSLGRAKRKGGGGRNFCPPSLSDSNFFLPPSNFLFRFAQCSTNK